MELPHKCFVSYSYSDIEAHQKLHKALPKSVKPFTFPPIDVSPDEMVSSKLIEAILRQEALIYLEGGYSAQSFWVAFERDFAIRAGKKVYAFNPETQEFTAHTRPSLKLPLFAANSQHDNKLVSEIVAFMREKRYFDALSFEDLPPKNTRRRREAVKIITRSKIIEKINKGGYLVVFWSKNAAASHHVEDEIQLGLKFSEYYRLDDVSPDFDRILFALLDTTPLPDWFVQRNRMNSSSVVKPVQLYSGDRLSLTNRIDDLIVRLYWLIYRNTQQNGLQ